MSKNENLKVSIIVPVYNAAKYLEKSIASLTNQSYRNIEIILIDDGSKDESLKVCNRLAQQDSRILVIHQDNQGVSAARNNATKASTGEYVMYFDSDDVLAKFAIQKAVECAKNFDADFVIGAAVRIHSLDEFHAYNIEADAHSDIAQKLLPHNEYDLLRRQYFQGGNKEFSSVKGVGYFNRAPHAKLLRRSFALETPFPINTPIGEDLLWNLRLLKICKKVVLVYDIWYGYVQYASSAVRKYHGDRAQKVSEYLILLKKENEGFFSANINTYVLNVAVELYCIANYELMSSECHLSKKEKKELLKNLIASEPWNILWEPGMKNFLPRMYQVMLPLYKTGLWIWALRLKK
ncbi:glycosyltransferase family 2 protein [Holdemania massiliensis]|uniref:glycosyltransferase family 2 protein n=1 Tax=Holdemania massiliensis TaxID=1468449 RepID=UPI001F059B2E|nr:glycosyltransferase family A protein [Holdemania massiliensis]MCH1940971.1 glycosyltransferase [Holdemania massiliensis]